MEHRELRNLAGLVSLGLVVALASPGLAYAYVGPGLGLAAVASFLSILAALLLGVVGFVWYPVKRLIRAVRNGHRKNA